MDEKLKIKPLTESQIIVAIDRLTRFKPTEDKYLRVFKEVITSNLILPKYKKKDLDLMDYDELRNLAQEIFNFSLSVLNYQCKDAEDAEDAEDVEGDFIINKKLLEYEKKVFILDSNTQKLLDNKIDYKAAIKLIALNPPLNLKWLKSLQDSDNQVKNRENFGLKFPLEKVIIVEGITEEILLPKFAKIYGFDFDKAGITLISAGGKNQVVKLFYQFAELLKLPMFVLLDNDAKQNFYDIQPKLRQGDRVRVLECGEFEDVLPLNLIKRTLNKHLKNYSTVALDELRKDEPMTQILEEVFKQRGLEFKKAEFATLVCQNILSSKDVSAEIESIIKEIQLTLKSPLAGTSKFEIKSF